MLLFTWDIFKADGVGYCDIYLPVCIQIYYGPSLALHKRGLTLQTTFPRLLFFLGWAKGKYSLVLPVKYQWEGMWNKERSQDISLPLCSLNGVFVL